MGIVIFTVVFCVAVIVGFGFVIKLIFDDDNNLE